MFQSRFTSVLKADNDTDTDTDTDTIIFSILVYEILWVIWLEVMYVGFGQSWSAHFGLFSQKYSVTLQLCLQGKLSHSLIGGVALWVLWSNKSQTNRSLHATNFFWPNWHLFAAA